MGVRLFFAKSYSLLLGQGVWYYCLKCLHYGTPLAGCYLLHQVVFKHQCGYNILPVYSLKLLNYREGPGFISVIMFSMCHCKMIVDVYTGRKLFSYEGL